MGVLHWASYGTGLAAFLFITLSIASGLLYVAEVIEEHSRLAKTIATRAIYVIIVLHLALYFVDSLPLTHIAFSIVCHLVYLRNIGPTWPLISISSPTFIASCLLVLADHFLWFFYFADKSKAARRTRGTYRRGDPGPSFGDISTFFAICVWCVPLFLFLSLSANDNVLPSNGHPPSSPSAFNLNFSSSGPAQSHHLHERRSILKRILDPILFLLPTRRGRRQMDDGNILPSSRTHSPAPSQPSSPSWASTSFTPRPPAFIETSNTSGSVGSMNPLPPRGPSEVVLNGSGTGEGLGIRTRRAPVAD